MSLANLNHLLLRSKGRGYTLKPKKKKQSKKTQIRVIQDCHGVRSHSWCFLMVCSASKYMRALIPLIHTILRGMKLSIPTRLRKMHREDQKALSQSQLPEMNKNHSEITMLK